MSPLRCLLLTLAGAMLFATPPTASATVEWVAVGDPGNACDPQAQGCFGSVDKAYKIGTYEISNQRYAEFLNAVDPTGANELELYNPLMSFDPMAELLFEIQHGGIVLEPGNANGEKYEVKEGYADRPVVYVSFYDAVRFANWLNNGQGPADTETGSYTLLGGTAIPSNGLTVTRNLDAAVFLASEDEWYKAAYYGAASTSYFDHSAGTDVEMVCDLPGPTPNTANCNGGLNVGTLTDVGTYTGSASPFGTYDQGGNTWEWNETIIGLERVLRGGGWANTPSLLGAATRLSFDPATGEFWDVGFRVASAFPACSNGFDDDGDGLIDYPDDPGCDDAEDDSERSPTLPCDDGIDNDGDGLIDYPADPGCFNSLSLLENPQCQDGRDNDGDGRIDFDGGASLDLDGDGFIDAAFNPAMPEVGAPDPQCGNPAKNREAANNCGLGVELAFLLPGLWWARRRRTTSVPGSS